MKKVFIATTTFGEDDPSVLEALKAAGWSYVLNPYHRRLSDLEIKDVVSKGEFQGLLAGLETLNKEILSAARGLSIISRVGVGMDNVDQIAAKALGIQVFNTPGVLTDSVAELTLGLMLAALRKIAWMDRKMRAGQWEKRMGALLKGKTVGIIGFGAIGQRVADLCLAFGAEVIFTDVRSVQKQGARQVVFEGLIKSADIISLHSSGKECLIESVQIAQMKQGVVIINTARGALIDEAALLKGLSTGKIGCAALDVFEREPYQGKLLEQENVVLTAHIGSYAKEARVVMEKMAVENLIKGFGDKN
ncbi:MAG: phosphoglycerate dehydrogenase [Candidatus Omnitrophota bacterium]